MAQTVEEGFSAVIRGSDVMLDSELLLDDWIVRLGTPRCVKAVYGPGWCLTSLQLDLAQPAFLESNGIKTLLNDGSDSGRPALQDALEAWFLKELSCNEHIQETVCGQTDGWVLSDFKSSVAGASCVVLPVGVLGAVELRAAESDRNIPYANRTNYSVAAGISTGVAYFETGSRRHAELLIGSSFTLHRKADGIVVADVPRQIRLSHAKDSYRRISFPWLGNGHERP